MATQRTKKSKQAARRKAASRRKKRPHCGLCGATGNLTKTECCDQWICDDEHEYELFSYARTSCHRNHRRYTLCGGHFEEGHDGHWKDCPQCRNNIEPEMYVYYGTNEYNFEILKDPPDYEPTKCSACGAVIALAEGGYSISGGNYLCFECTSAKSPGIFDRI